MKWILILVVLFCAGCARDRLTVAVHSVYYIEQQPIEIGAKYEFSH